jgi:hypothetical protein
VSISYTKPAEPFLSSDTLDSGTLLRKPTMTNAVVYPSWRKTSQEWTTYSVFATLGVVGMS